MATTPRIRTRHRSDLPTRIGHLAAEALRSVHDQRGATVAKDPKLDRLHATPLFSGSDKKELQRLAAAIDLVDVEAGATLIRQGAVNHEAFVIESGEAEVQIDGNVVATIPHGEMVGEIGLLTRARATATVVAKTPMSLLLIDHRRFDAIAEDTPGLGLAIAKELAQRLRATDERLQ